MPPSPPAPSLDRLGPLIEKFVGGSSRSKLLEELRAHRWNWSTRTQSGSRILSVLLEERWKRPVFDSTRGEASSFYDALCEVLETWEEGAARRRAELLLAMTSLAQKSANDRTLLGPLRHGPFLPQALEAATEVAKPSPTAPHVHQDALAQWVERMGQDPDPRWLARWPQSPRDATGALVRGPSSRPPFFQHEFGAPTPHGLAGWCVVPWLMQGGAASLVQRLHDLAPPASHGDWYAQPEAAGAYLRLLASVNPHWQPRSRLGDPEEAIGPAWDAGWRPPVPEQDPEGWMLLQQAQPPWASWLSARMLAETLPDPVSPPGRFRL